jgi:hypothetical protein
MQVPFLLFELMLLIIYSLSFAKLGNLEGPISELNTVQHLMYRNGRVRTFAFQMAFSESDEERAYWAVSHAQACVI